MTQSDVSPPTLVDSTALSQGEVHVSQPPTVHYHLNSGGSRGAVGHVDFAHIHHQVAEQDLPAVVGYGTHAHQTRASVADL